VAGLLAVDPAGATVVAGAFGVVFFGGCCCAPTGSKQSPSPSAIIVIRISDSLALLKIAGDHTRRKLESDITKYSVPFYLRGH